MSFAKTTQVPVERTKQELEHVLRRAGTTQVVSGHDTTTGVAFVQFGVEGRSVRLMLRFKPGSDREFTHDPSGKERTPEHAWRNWQQHTRTRWRQLLLIVKAKIEAVECGIATMEEEFLAQMVLPNSTTLGDALLPYLDEMRAKGLSPSFLPALPAPRVIRQGGAS